MRVAAAIAMEDKARPTRALAAPRCSECAILKPDTSMATTLLFAELLIIGMQVVVWLAILIVDVFGIEWLAGVPLQDVSVWQIPFLAVGFSVAYVLGILFDRIADSVFLPWDARLRKRILGNQAPSVGVARFELAKDNERLHTYFEYTRSRVRIARASALNIGLTAVLSMVLVLTRIPGLAATDRTSLAAFVAILGCVLVLSSVFAWQKLMVGYFTFVKTYQSRYRQPSCRAYGRQPSRLTKR
jgi:hypothetical protein